MKAVILAAGAARRLAPLTDGTNTCRLRVGGRSLLDPVLEALAAERIEATVIVVGHCQDQVRAEAGDRRGAMRIRFAATYLSLLAASIEESGGINEYADALHALLAEVPVGWADVTALPWTQIDLVEDLRRAEAVVLPLIEGLRD